MQLYLIRHCQSENNALWASSGSSEGRFPDPLLTAVGHRQAGYLAEFLAKNHEVAATNGVDPNNRLGFGLTHLYCSLMERAVITGTYIARATGLPLVAWEEIHEHGGIYYEDEQTGERIGLPGPNRAYFERRYPHFLLPDYLDAKGWWNRPFEEREQASERARRVLHDLIQKHGEREDRVALVTHGGFFMTFLTVLFDFTRPNEVLGKPIDVWVKMNNASITRIDFEPERARLMYLNRVDFLPTELLT